MLDSTFDRSTYPDSHWDIKKILEWAYTFVKNPAFFRRHCEESDLINFSSNDVLSRFGSDSWLQKNI